MTGQDCIIIAIDGPAGSGKSTLARGLARSLGIRYLNSGATYRALAVKAIDEGIDPSDEEAASRIAGSAKIEVVSSPHDSGERIILDGVDITDRVFRPEISIAASKISRHKFVREKIVELQREIVRKLCEEHESRDRPVQDSSRDSEQEFRGVVVEGRDIGTVVFPDANVKIYLDASLEERARRRMEDDDPSGNISETMTEVLERDVSDIRRSVSPLRPASDAVTIDNTGWEIERTLNKALEIVRKRIAKQTRL
jgi:cytidylate kinase